MAKNGEAAAKPAAGQGAGLALAILLGGGLGVLLLLLLTLLISVLVLVCLATSGMDGFHEQFIGILLMTLAGGCLAGLLGKPKKRKKKKA